jgi:ribonucleoside-diphosphate reductase alpha chain
MTSIPFENWTEQRKKVWLDRYAKKGPDGLPVESDPSEMWGRVADAIADEEGEADAFYRILEDFKFVPGGRILAGAGIEAQVTPYNCFVIPIRNETHPENGNDSREAIFDTRNRMVNIMSRGGGVGINWSTLRPNGSYLKRVNGTTSGPVAWMNAASVDVGTVMQGGSRRGAAMFMLWDWHPDIEEFINHKRDEKLTTNANISVAISDGFMEAVKRDDDWILRFPDTSHAKYNTDWDGDLSAWVDAGLPVVEHKKVRARDLWRQMADAAHASGEPGIVFLERYNKLSSAREEEKIICVNPCGEQGLGPYSVCNLGSMNLAMYVNGKFDFESFKEDVKVAIRFLDNVVDKAYYGEEFKETYEQQMKLRRIGLGVMGLADALIELKITYGSKEAVEFTEAVYKAMRYAAIDASVALAKEKGPAPAWSPNKAARHFYGGTEQNEFEWAKARELGIPPETHRGLTEHGIRNMFLLTQAPTGTTSLLAGVNSGIEPYFAFELIRKDRTNTDGWDFIAPPMREYLARGGDPAELPEWFVTTNDLSIDQHIDMMAAAQKHVDSSISKTINAPKHASVNDVEQAYMAAYDRGLKAVAYYRDGSRQEQVLNHKVKETLENEVVAVNGIEKHPEPERHPYKRGSVLRGTTRKYPTALGTAFITVNKDEYDEIREIFVNVGKAGSDVQQLSEAVARVVSTSLQHDVAVHAVRAQLQGVGGYGKMRKSLPSAIADALEEAEDDDDGTILELVSDEGLQPIHAVPEEEENIGSLCPNCQEFSVIRTNGCMECSYQCGYTAC